MKKAVIFGAGNIGRGFIGQLYSESGYEVVFVDVDNLLIETLAARGGYTIQMVDNTQTREVCVAPVRALHSQQQAGQVIQVLAEANLAATALGARILPAVAPLIAESIRQRKETGCSEPLNLIVCENLKDAAAHLRGLVYAHLEPDEQAYAQRLVGFVDTVIGRMVPPPTPEMRQQDPSLILVEPYQELPVDRHGFKGAIPTIKGMEPCDNFPAYVARKLYIHNCGHAVLAYLGYLYGYQYGYDAMQDGQIIQLLEQSLCESRAGIVAEYRVKAEWLEQHTRELLQRFTNRALGDPVFRLGRDPLRKLAPHDRLVGAARLAEKAGLVPQALSWGIAAGYLFDAPEDPLALELQKRIAQEGITNVLSEVSGIQPGERLGVLVEARYASLSAS
jgi:mannitol-1-phosphate 5-dehydrogenase